MDVVLISPEIPQNTGSIARTCAATNTHLHLVHPMKFVIDEKRVRRAGLDYWPHVCLNEHTSWAAFRATYPKRRLVIIEEYGTLPYYAHHFSLDDMLVFGSETTGVPHSILEAEPLAQVVAIPMVQPKVRSLNLSNAASIVLFEARRQLRLDEPFIQRTPQMYELPR